MMDQSQNELPEIRIDRNGVWYFHDMEMTRIEIVQYLYDHLRRDSQGQYRIELDHEQCLIQVDDVPFVIRSVTREFSEVEGRPYMSISLSDGSREELKPETIRINEKNVLYCRVKQCNHEARFSRPAYYQLCEYIEYDYKQDRYFMTVDGHSYLLAVNQPTENGGPHVK
jgi:hypothetical protein